MDGFPKNQRGIALFLVLWVLALLTVIAGEFSHAVRTEANTTRNFKEETQAHYIAISGLFWTIQQLVANDYIPRPVTPASETRPGDLRWRVGGDIPPVPFGEGYFKVERENESGKVNLNRADEQLLKVMLSSFGLEPAARDTIVDSILDWRDRDSFHRVNGAEDDYYLSLPRPYKCRNGEFTTVEELLLVRGVTPKIFHDGLKDIVSVYQDEEPPPIPLSQIVQMQQAGLPIRDPRRIDAHDFRTININAAPPLLLRSLPGMTEEAFQAILNSRRTADFRSGGEVQPLVGSAVYAGIARYLSVQTLPYYRIKSVGMLEGSKTRKGVQAVVKIDRSFTKGYEIIQWIDGLAYRP